MVILQLLQLKLFISDHIPIQIILNITINMDVLQSFNKSVNWDSYNKYLYNHHTNVTLTGFSIVNIINSLHSSKAIYLW